MPQLALQCPSGISGDMLLGALLDLGASLDRVRRAVDAVAPEPVTIDVEPVRRAGFAAVKAHVGVEESHHHRGWQQIRDLLLGAGSALSDGARGRALAAFSALAEAEAGAHGVTVDDVHFHEVGALDAIADIVGVCAGLEDLGIEEIHCGPVAVGSGTVQTSHGPLSVPTPAVVALFAGTDAILTPGSVESELCTPTGAALLVSQVRRWGTSPAARVLRAGAGAGTADHPQLPNVVRAMLVEPAAAPTGDLTRSSAYIVAANVDDLDPRIWPHTLEVLLGAGADDAWLVPVVMKKGRPAHQVEALCPAWAVTPVRDALLRETTTIGVRVAACEKHAAPRTERIITIDGHRVRIKEAWVGDELINLQPEFDDVAAVAEATGRPVRAVLDRARVLADQDFSRAT